MINLTDRPNFAVGAHPTGRQGARVWVIGSAEEIATVRAFLRPFNRRAPQVAALLVLEDAGRRLRVLGSTDGTEKAQLRLSAPPAVLARVLAALEAAPGDKGRTLLAILYAAAHRDPDPERTWARLAPLRS